MNPFTIGAAAIPSIFAGITGAIQAGRGRRMAASNIRPTYSRPSEANTALSLAENNYLNGSMPGKANLISQLGSANANSLEMAKQAASSGNDVLDAITKLNYNEQQQLNTVADQEVQYQDKLLADYQNQLATSAQYSDKEFSYNKDQPFQDKAAAASALIEAGNTNIGNGVNGGSTLLTSALMGGMFDKKKNPASSAASAGINFSGKRMIYDPYTKKVSFSN